MKLGYILTEGYVDVESIGGLLKNKNISRVIKESELCEYWAHSGIIPIGFPYKGDLTKRVPVPAFFQNSEFSIAIHCADGNLLKMYQYFRGTLITVPNITEEMTGIGIVGDADEDVTSTFRKIKDLFADLLTLPDKCGEISKATPQTGVFLFPDNQNSGTIEKILLQCAVKSYPEILSRAERYIQSVDQDLKEFDRKNFDQPAGKEKATVGCVANILKPGKSVQVSIQDNNWICDQTIEQTELSKLCSFITRLFRMT